MIRDKRFSLHLLCLLSALCTVSFDKISEAQNHPPQLIIDGGSSTAPITGLSFSPDSSLLYVSGLDKTVQVWHLEDLEDSAFEATRVQQLYWETGRHRRGEIAALAVSPTDGTIAFAGRGARTSNGEIVLLDPANAQYEQVLPSRRERGIQNGHDTTVLHLDFSPDGTKLLSISEDREVRIWTLSTGQSAVLRPRNESGKFPPFLSAIFLNNQQVAFLDQVKSPQGNVENVVMLMSSTGQGSANKLPGSNAELWRSLCRSFNGDEVFGGVLGGILGWKLNKPQPDREIVIQSPHEFFTSIHERAGLLFISGISGNERTPFARIVNRQSKLTEELNLGWKNSPYHCLSNISPDGRWFAVATNASTELKIWRMQPGKITPSAGPLQLKSRILPPQQAQFTTDQDDPYQLRITFPEDRQQAPQAIDLSVGATYPPAAVQEWAESTQADGYVLLRDDKQPLQGIIDAKSLLIKEGGESICRIDLANEQSTTASYAWLKDANKFTWGLAVGTSYPDCGIYIYKLNTNQQPCQMIHYFRDHRSNVTSLTQSSDGKVLASTSLDGTTKLWTLNGINEPAPQVTLLESAWGMEFTLQQNGLHVDKVYPHSIAATNKILPNDIIEAIKLPGPNTDPLETSSQRILNWLTNSPLYATQYLRVNSRGKPREFYVTPGWEPLLTLIIDQRKEWVAVAPDGRFESSILEGDRLINWLVSRGRDAAPEIIAGPDLPKELKQFNFFEDIFDDLSQAPPNPTKLELFPERPALKIVSPVMNVVYPADQDIEIRVELSHKNLTLEESAWFALVGNTPLGPPDTHGSNWAVWNYQPQNSLEEIIVRATVPDQTLGNKVSARQFVRSTATSTKAGYRIHLITAGVDPTGRLEYAERDALALDNHFKTQPQNIFRMGYQQSYTNEAATTDNLLKSMEQAAKGIESRSDVFVLFLSGHGHVHEGEYCFISHDWTNGEPPTSNAKILTTNKIKEAFDKIRCRRILILDTCNSDSSVTGFSEDGKNLRDDGIMIFLAACGEVKEAKDGVFTNAILKGLRGGADGYAQAGSQNRQITMPELVTYVIAEVQKNARTQVPGFVPSSFVETNQTRYVDSTQVLKVISEIEK